MTSPTYRVLIDWDSDGGLHVGEFESGIGSWNGQTFGTVVPALSRSTVRSFHGSASLLVEWAGGATELVQFAAMGSFVVGESYRFSAMVYVPATGGRHVTATLAGIGFGSTSAVTDSWTEVSITFTATATTHVLQLWTSGTPSAGDKTWVDQARVSLSGEEVSAAVPGVVSQITMGYGRDRSRALSPVGPGEASFAVDNASRDYSPENSSSPLAGFLGPGRDMVIEAIHDGRCYALFTGSVDDFEVDSSPGSWLATFTGIDLLARLKDHPVSTPVYPCLRTGEAIGVVLDAVGWSGARDIDVGASSLRWWWVEADDAYQVLQDILAAEGPAALMTVGLSGEFIFRDRHHRLLRAASLTSQATFTNEVAVAPDVELESPVLVDSGWRDLINHVEIQVAEREPGQLAEEIWSTDDAFTVAVGQLVEFTISTDVGFWDLQPATQGTPDSVTSDDPELASTGWRPDVIRTGGPVTVAYARTSGQSTTVTITASSTAVVSSVRLRAHKIGVSGNGQRIVREDAESIRQTRGVRPYKPAVAMHSHDGDAVADLVLGQRAQRLPAVTFDVTNGNAGQLVQILSRDLSDRVTVVDSESGIDGEFYIEAIDHRVMDEGLTHRATFGCEKVRSIPDDLFTFDVTGAGWDDGRFAASGLDDPATIFVFDAAGHGFNDGRFAT